MPIIIGTVTLNQTLARPRLADIHSVDVVSLLGAGVCFGVAMVLIARIILNR